MEEEDEQEIARHTVIKAALATAAACVVHYYNTYVDKEPCRINTQAGNRFVMEILDGNPTRCQEQFRMEKEVFISFCKLLRHRYGLQKTRDIGTHEQVAMFLMTLGHGASNRMLQHRFEHSGETISRHFHEVLTACVKLSMDNVKPHGRHAPFPEYLRSNPKFWPHFQNCIGAIDGTHVKANLPVDERIPFICRKGYPTQNIMAACGWDMCFTFAWPGWEGAAQDTQIFYQAIQSPNLNFPKPVGDEFYLVDTGYPNIRGYLCPYRGERYHLPDFQRGSQPQNLQELFNQAHSSLRLVIERTFEVWKARWRLLANMPQYDFPIQVQLIAASMAIHNFIRREAVCDQHFQEYDMNPDLIPTNDTNMETEESYHGADVDDGFMNAFRDGLAIKIASSI
uniref:Uncharacterized protein n=1 Tax=Davidia involucrata TaxID=16924 RepID=A0A5B6Z1I6_DAVIN